MRSDLCSRLRACIREHHRSVVTEFPRQYSAEGNIETLPVAPNIRPSENERIDMIEPILDHGKAQTATTATR
jgi:hypothetical protein